MIWERVYRQLKGTGARPDKALLPVRTPNGTIVVYALATDETVCAACASRKDLGKDIVQAYARDLYDATPICVFCQKPITGEGAP